MRRLVGTVLPLLLVPVAISCAQGLSNTAGQGGGGAAPEGRGGGATIITSPGSSSSSSGTSGISVSTSSSSGSSGSSGSTSGGSAGCGLSSSDPTCNSCLDASCCNEATACANDASCVACLGTSTPPASCNTNAALGALLSCLQASCNTECLGGGSSGSSSGSSIPGTCAQAGDTIGCCGSDGAVYFCDAGQLATLDCAGNGLSCGWNDTAGYYDCVTSATGPDPSGTYPMACGGSSGSTSSSSSSSSSSGTTSSGSATTWTQLYNGIFGPSGTSSCVAGGGCHTTSQSGFKCGTSKSSCYSGIVSSGLVTTGSGAPGSALVTAGYSPLCGSLGGNMPQGGTCVSSTKLAQIKSWLAAGAPNN